MNFSDGRTATATIYAKEDRRTFARMNAGLFIRYCPQFCLRHRTAQSCDISAQGVGLVTCESLPAGRKVELWIRMPTDNREIPVRGKVIWSRRYANGQFRVGMDLDKPDLMGIAVLMRMMRIHARSYA